jgi:hypothetical protein
VSAATNWIGTLSTVGAVLTLLVLLVGLIVTIVAFFRKGKSRVALLGAIGFLLMFLLSCCGTTLRVLPVARLLRDAPKIVRTFPTAQAIIVFLLTLLNLIGLILIIVAISMGSKKEEPL